MHLGKTLLGTALAAGFVALPLSSASAAYPCNPITGIFGAAATVAGAAVTIGTAPLVVPPSPSVAFSGDGLGESQGCSSFHGRTRAECGNAVARRRFRCRRFGRDTRALRQGHRLRRQLRSAAAGEVSVPPGDARYRP